MNNFLLLLALLFIALKLMGFVLWSWWWVLSPLLIIVAFLIAFAVFAIIMTKRLIKEGKKRKTKNVDSSEKDILLKKLSEDEIEVKEIS